MEEIMTDIRDISPVAKPIPQQITIEVVGDKAAINVVGLAPLQVVMLLSQFIGVVAGQLHKGQEPARIVVPGVVR